MQTPRTQFRATKSGADLFRRLWMSLAVLTLRSTFLVTFGMFSCLGCYNYCGQRVRCFCVLKEHFRVHCLVTDLEIYSVSDLKSDASLGIAAMRPVSGSIGEAETEGISLNGFMSRNQLAVDNTCRTGCQEEGAEAPSTGRISSGTEHKCILQVPQQAESGSPGR